MCIRDRHKTADGCVQYTKGAPDEVLRRCTHIWQGGQAVPLTPALRGEVLAANKAMADKALRVLACAMRAWPQPPQDTSPENLEQGLTFLGLAGMIDPIRPEVKAAIAECREAGIRPVMITGDHRDTAVAIARQLGILDDERAAITGAQLDELSDEEFERRVGEFSVYARVQPEHKAVSYTHLDVYKRQAMRW